MFFSFITSSSFPWTQQMNSCDFLFSFSPFYFFLLVSQWIISPRYLDFLLISSCWVFIEKLTPSPFLLFLRTSINLENRYNFFGLFGSFVDGLKKLKTFPYTKLNFSARCFNYSVIKTSFLLVVIESSHRNSEIVKNSLRGVFTASWVAIYLLGFIFALIDQYCLPIHFIHLLLAFFMLRGILHRSYVADQKCGEFLTWEAIQ